MREREKEIDREKERVKKIETDKQADGRRDGKEKRERYKTDAVREVTDLSCKLGLPCFLVCAKYVISCCPQNSGTTLDVRVPSFTSTEDAKARWKTT